MNHNMLTYLMKMKLQFLHGVAGHLPQSVSETYKKLEWEVLVAMQEVSSGYLGKEGMEVLKSDKQKKDTLKKVNVE